MNIFQQIETANQKSRKLSTRDAENISKYKSSNYINLYEEEEEDKIFDIVKSVRKERNYSPIPLKEKNPKTYWNLVINKPKLQSPAGTLVSKKPEKKPTTLRDYISSSLNRTLDRKEEEGIWLLDIVTQQSSPKKEVQGIINDFIPSLTKEKQDEIINDTWKTGSQAAASSFIWALEAIEKPVNKLAYYSGEQDRNSQSLLKSLWKELNNDWLLTNIKNSIGLENKLLSESLRLGTDALKWINPLQNLLFKWVWGAITEQIEWPSTDIRGIKNRLFWWVQPWLTPNLTSLEENRRREIDNLKWKEKEEAQRFLEENKNEILAKDVLVGIWTGVLWAWAVKTAIKQVPKTSKAYKALQVVDETVNPSLNNMAKVWGVLAANAALYYWKTGEFVYWWDDQSEEWAIAASVVLWLKALWLSPEIAKWGTKYVKDLLSNKDLQDWMSNFFESYAKKIWAISNFIDDTGKQIPVEELSNTQRQDIWKRWTALKWIQDSLKEFWDADMKYTFLEEKKDILKSFIDDWLVKIDWTDKKGVRFKFTDDYWKVIFGQRYNPEQPIINHLPKKFAKDIIDISNLRPINPDIPFEDVKKTFRQVQEKQAKTDSRIVQKIKKEWMWDDSKWFTNIANYALTYFKSRIFSNSARVVGKALWDKWPNYLTFKNATRYVEENLYQTLRSNRMSNNYRRLEKFSKEIKWDDLLDFNTYIEFKNIKDKMLKNASQWKDYVRTIAREDWSKVKMSLEDINSYVREFERSGKGEIFKRYSKTLNDINKETINYEVSAGILTREQADELLERFPNYMPNKIDDLEKALNIWTNLDKLADYWPYKAALKEGSEMTYNANTIENFLSNQVLRHEMVKKYEALNSLLDFWKDVKRNGESIIRLAKKNSNWKYAWYNPDKGETIVKTFINWEEQGIIMPKFFKDALEEQLTINPWVLRKAIWLPKYIISQYATGKLAPQFQLQSVTWEIPTAFFTVTAKLWPKAWLWYLKDSVWALTRWKFFGDMPQTWVEYKMLKDLSSATGWDFTRIQAINKEFNDWLQKEIKAATEAKNIGKWVSEKLDFWHNIELITARYPALWNWLKSKWINKTKWKELSKQSDESWVPIDILLKDLWINPKEWGSVARNIFDYQAWSKWIKEANRVIPYFSTGVAWLKWIWTIADNPKVFTGALWGAYLTSQMLYNYNFGGERGKEMRGQGDWLKYRPWFSFKEWDEWTTIDVGRNIQFIEWMYPLVVEMNEARGAEVPADFKKWLNQIWKDISLVGDLESPVWINLSKLPAWLKEIIEVAANQDFFFKREIADSTGAFEWLELNDINSNTKPWAVKFATNLSKALSVFADEPLTQEADWTWTWWVQINPNNLQHFLKIGDPTNYEIGKTILEINKWVEENKPVDWLLKSLWGMFSKQYKDMEGWDEVWDVQARWIDEVRRKKIRTQIYWAKNQDELKNITRDMIWVYSNDEKILKYIDWQVGTALLKFKYWWEFATSSKLSTEEYIEYLTLKEQNWTLEKNDIQNLIKSKIFSKDKTNDILKWFDKALWELKQ